MLEYLTRNRRDCGVRTSPASQPCVLEHDSLTNPCLVLGQPRKTRPNITEKFVQIKQIVASRGAPF